MLVRLLFLCIFFVSLVIDHALAQDYGTPAEAKAMLERAVAALKTDREKALAQFTSGSNNFRNNDIYPFCGDRDGKFVAHPTLVGKSLIDLKDAGGKPIGKELYNVAVEGKIREIEFVGGARTGGGGDPCVIPTCRCEDRTCSQACCRRQAAYVTKIGDIVCAVVFYKQ